MLKIGFLGGGNMARAIVAGLVSSGADPKLVTVMDRHPEKLAALREQFGITTQEKPGDWIGVDLGGVHDVREHQAVLDAVRASGCRRVLIHGFTGSREVAMEYLRLGALISLGPRAEGCRSFPDLIRLPFVTESDMPAGEEERRVLAGWNRKLSELTGIDIGERTERIMKEVLG